ncbi:MAG: hypothetical protein K2J47_08410, partial [Ruminococcus sp.]|nr:hypothetical protein [Ruminococcus sp.]
MKKPQIEEISLNKKLFLFCSKALESVHEHQEHERVEFLLPNTNFFNCCIYYIAKAGNLQYIKIH